MVHRFNRVIALLMVLVLLVTGCGVDIHNDVTTNTQEETLTEDSSKKRWKKGIDSNSTYDVDNHLSSLKRQKEIQRSRKRLLYCKKSRTTYSKKYSIIRKTGRENSTSAMLETNFSHNLNKPAKIASLLSMQFFMPF